ncbi:MAG: Cysteine desulfurase [Candidatus Carbobacillus altaicus]|uniref:cysteine desulfurase n=1 Tax=Candidatus Carbonibacillus altaicus TaxID=2163959 RepID=A0A2R6Y165_9BACL|nr:MAG: Cysteine desulfurase [Candidatus Carbobacillus altaicus]
MIYLDHSASTPVVPPVLEAYVQAMRDHFANPHALHALGEAGSVLLEAASRQIAGLLGTDERHVIFTSGGTESNNLALLGLAEANTRYGKRVILSAIEHPSVLEVGKRLVKYGFEVVRAPVDRTGRLDLEAFESVLTGDTVLVSVMAVNNELGSRQPIQDIARIVRKKTSAVIHVDAVQAYVVDAIDMGVWDVDALSLSGHKLHAPKGIGLLALRPGVSLVPQMEGGGQQFGLRPGTVNVPLIAALARALRLAAEEREAFVQKARSWWLRLYEGITALGGEVLSPRDGAPHILFAAFPGKRGEVLVRALSERGVYVSTRSACSSKRQGPSHVLQAMGLSEVLATGTLRFSMAKTTTDEEIEGALNALADVLKTI